MPINKHQLRDNINSTLSYLGLHSKVATELLMMTCAQESLLGQYLHQVKGPAEGYFQIEPATERDIWNNYLRYKSALASKIKALIPGGDYSRPTIPNIPHMRVNLSYQICMARIHYYRVPEKLPINTPQDLARYYKKYYNTYLGKATPEQAIRAYTSLCL